MFADRTFFYKLVGVMFIGVFLAGCGQEKKQADQSGEVALAKTEELDIAQADGSVLVVEDTGKLVAVETKSGKTKTVKELTADELPSIRTTKTFLMAPSKRWVVWYAPIKGILAYNPNVKENKELYKPGEWFKKNPFWIMSENEDKIWLMENEGAELVSVEIETGTVNRTQVSQGSFGTGFQIAPDKSLVAFIASYEPDATAPVYMITKVDGTEAREIKTTGPVGKREIITWHPLSKSLLVLGETGEVWEYPINSGQKRLFYEDKKKSEIIEIQTSNKTVLITTKRSFVTVDENGDIRGDYPKIIWQDITKPKVVEMSGEEVVVEEEIVAGEQRFFRLWRSNWFGNKELLYPSYHQIRLVREPVELEDF